MVTPSATSRSRMRRAIATAAGLSPCTQMTLRVEPQDRAVDRLDRACRWPAAACGRPPARGRAAPRPARGATRARPSACRRGRRRPRRRRAGPAARARSRIGAPGRPMQHQRRVDRADRRRSPRRPAPASCGDGVVERAVRLDVAHARAGGAGEPLQRADLVDHVGGQLGRAPRPSAAGRSRRGRDRRRGPRPPRPAPRPRAAWRRIVSGSPAWKPQATLAELTMREHRGVVAHRPGAVALAEVAVEVDDASCSRRPAASAGVSQVRRCGWADRLAAHVPGERADGEGRAPGAAGCSGIRPSVRERAKPIQAKIVRPIGRIRPLKPPAKTSSAAGAVPMNR